MQLYNRQVKLGVAAGMLVITIALAMVFFHRQRKINRMHQVSVSFSCFCQQSLLALRLLALATYLSSTLYSYLNLPFLLPFLTLQARLVQGGMQADPSAYPAQASAAVLMSTAPTSYVPVRI
jgi:hypothetical protein